MLTVEQIEAAILKLPPDKFKILQEWFLNLDHQQWDKQLEQNIANGKLDALAREAISDFEAGHYKAI